MTPPIMYNLFPRLVGPTTRWPEHAVRARDLGFNCMYLNPWHMAGFSGSLYAVKEFDCLNPLFLPPGADPASLEPLRTALEEINGLGLAPIMDLVVNHTSKDSPLVTQHPEWYMRDERGEVVSPWVADPDDPGLVTVWGDLAEIDNANSMNREALWAFWAAQVRQAVALGFRGFRCDAAYKVPAELWGLLIREARAILPEVQFFAETLGGPVEDVLALREAGFDYFFNSSKWWNFNEQWALDQHARFGAIAPSMSFPETHDTTRLAAETGGNQAVQKQRYAFAAAFSAGVMMPVGYEFGFRKQVNVVETMPSDWERRRMDLRPFVKRVNELKLRHPLLHGEGDLSAPSGLGHDVLLLERRVDDQRGWILVNKSADLPAQAVLPGPGLPPKYRVFRVCRDGAPADGDKIPERLQLDPAEVAYMLPAL